MRSRSCTRRRVSQSVLVGRSAARGFAASYLVFAIGLMTLVALGISRMNDDQAERRLVTQSQRMVLQQADLIRAQVVLCGTMYPSGNNGTAFRPRFPATPVSGLVADLDCPGDPNANRNLWRGQYGVTLPAAPFGLSAWRYANDATSLRIWIDVSGNPSMVLALQRAAAQWPSADATYDSVNQRLTLRLAS